MGAMLRLRDYFVAVLLLQFPLVTVGQAGAAEARTAQYMESIRTRTPELTAFLREMPKGGDLHNHLGGAIYAESMIAWGAQDSVCIELTTLRSVRPPCDSANRPPLSTALTNSTLYGSIIDAWSVRNRDRTRRNGHDQFFDTFGKFSAALERRTGYALAEVSSRAAGGNVSYLELMITAGGPGGPIGIGSSVRWTDDFQVMVQRLSAAGITDAVRAGIAEIDTSEVRRNQLLRCGTPTADPGCDVTMRYLYQVLRATQPAQIFAQILTGFMLASEDSRVVGINLVQPEDDYVALRDYSLHMRMIEYLRMKYPQVAVTLHAGELAPGLVPPEALRFHIGQAVRVAGAKRIGHGTAIMHENAPYELLREMANRRTLVEIGLSSSDIILNIRGSDHPLRTYLAHGVPVALATDDEGVARSDLSQEFLKAAREQNLTYVELKQMARNSIEYAFVAGASLWVDPSFRQRVPQCTDLDSRSCSEFIATSEKAILQRNLERAFARFEQKYAERASTD